MRCGVRVGCCVCVQLTTSSTSARRVDVLMRLITCMSIFRSSLHWVATLRRPCCVFRSICVSFRFVSPVQQQNQTKHIWTVCGQFGCATVVIAGFPAPTLPLSPTQTHTDAHMNIFIKFFIICWQLSVNGIVYYLATLLAFVLTLCHSIPLVSLATIVVDDYHNVCNGRGIHQARQTDRQGIYGWRAEKQESERGANRAAKRLQNVDSFSGLGNGTGK